MRRVSGFSMWWVVSGLIAVSGCSGEKGAPALASAADGGNAVAQNLATAGPLAERDVEPAGIPQTADKALRAVLYGLHEHRPDALWDALPASYQQDVSDLVHLFAARMHPQAWTWFLQIARKGAIVLRLPRDDREEASTIAAAFDDDAGDDDAGTVENVSVKDRIAILKSENPRLHGPTARRENHSLKMHETTADQQRREAVARLLDKIAANGPAGLETLKTVDAGSLLRRDECRTLLEAWHSATGAAMGTEEMQDVFALVADPSKIRLVLKNSTDDTAVVEIAFPNDVPGDIECVRVDGKWIPRLLSDAWAETISGLKRDVLESLPSETATENFGPLFQLLGMIDLSFDGELAHARSDGDDALAEVGRSALLDAPLMLLEFLIAGPRASEMDQMLADADGGLGDFSTRSEIRSQGDDSREESSVFEQLVGKSLAEVGKRVAVLCHSGPVVQAEHPTFAAGVIEEICRRFKAGNVNTVESDKIVSWTKEHAVLTADSDLTAFGTELDLDYIVDFRIDTLRFAEENYPELRRGRAQGHVVVVEMAVDQTGQKRPRVIFKQPFESKHPNNPAAAADPEEPDAFKQRYLARLHYELARLFLREP